MTRKTLKEKAKEEVADLVGKYQNIYPNIRVTAKQNHVLNEYAKRNIRENLRKSSRLPHLRLLVKLIQATGKEFQEITKYDIRDFFDNGSWKGSTALVYQRKLIKFFKWLYSGNYDDSLIDKNSDIIKSMPKIIIREDDTKINPDELWSLEEVKELIKTADHIQRKALIATLHDSEARVSELLSMNVSDVEVTGDIVTLFLRESKTRKRRVELLYASPYLLPWFEQRQKNAEPTDPLWTSLAKSHYGNRLTKEGVQSILRTTMKRSKINKHIYPHLLRHSMASHLRKEGFPDGLHCKRAGWVDGTDMLRRYTHIDDEEVSAKARKAFGVETEKDRKQKQGENPFKQRICIRCGAKNDGEQKYCHKCWYPLDYQTANHDSTLVEMFKTKYAEFNGLKIEKMLKEYQDLKSHTSDMTQFYQQFNGDRMVDLSKLKYDLNWSSGKFEHFIEYLLRSKLIRIENGQVLLETYFDGDGNPKTVFDNFIAFKEKLFTQRR